MKSKRIHRRIPESRAEKARIRAIRARFQKERPTLEQLQANGEFGPAIPLGTFLQLRQMLHSLKAERLKAGLSLTEVAKRSGMDKAAVSRLETGKQPNPTMDTLYRYAASIGKQLSWRFQDAPENVVAVR